MKLTIDIPREYERDFITDQFKDFFSRVIADINYDGMCGNYEKEIAEMFLEAFDKAINLSNVDEYSTDKLCHNVKIVKNKKSTMPFSLTALAIGIVVVILNIFCKGSPSLVIVNPFAIVCLSMFIGIYIGAQIFGK